MRSFVLSVGVPTKNDYAKKYDTFTFFADISIDCILFA